MYRVIGPARAGPGGTAGTRYYDAGRCMCHRPHDRAIVCVLVVDVSAQDWRLHGIVGQAPLSLTL